jgi:carbamoyl-phosphate synthase large subunit
MNVVISCAGRRSYLIRYFKEALGSDGKVIAVNSISESTSMIAADIAIKAPDIYSENYIDFLIQVCQEQQAKLLFSVFDLELPILANAQHRFKKAGIILAVSNAEFIEICNDKLKSAQYITQINGLESPKTTSDIKEAERWLDLNEVKFPLFVKPRFGMGSIGVYKAEDLEELHFYYGKVRDDVMKTYLKEISSDFINTSVIIQSSLPGEEYGMDVVNDFKGEHRATFVKKKLAMRAGETDSAVTEYSPILLKAAKDIAAFTRHLGNLDVDIFFDGEIVYVLEMNPRFGGGYPFSHLAGARVPTAYVAWAQGYEPESGWDNIEYGVIGLKEIQPIRMRYTTFRNLNE